MVDIESSILFESDELLVIDKWPGIPSTGKSLDDDDSVQWHVIQRAGEMVWAVHQLDADTSGVLLFAKRGSLVEPLKNSMAHADAVKAYVAIVNGSPAWSALSVDAPIGETARGLGVASAGRASRTTFQVLRAAADSALVHATLHTGRTHQIRIHAGHVGHPLVGEEWYARPPCERHTRQALHAMRLTLGPPFSLEFRSALPADLLEACSRLDLSPLPTDLSGDA